MASGKNLPLKGTGQSAEALHFAGEGAVAALTVSEQNGVMALYISGHLQRDRAKGRFFDSAEQNLSEKAAVTVAFSAPVGLEAYHSLYSIGFWKKPGAYGAGPFAFYSKGGAEKYFAKRPQSPLQKAG